jgi:hypothetical protein
LHVDAVESWHAQASLGVPNKNIWSYYRS